MGLADSESPRLDAELLLAHVLDVERAALIRERSTPVAPGAHTRFQALLAERQRGRPLAQLIGHREFWSLDLDVDEHVLVPRPETESLVTLALEFLPPDAAAVIADLGTGSGAVAIAIARERPRAFVLASDSCGAALAVAARNMARHGLGNLALLQADWLRGFAARRFALIVANPPYVAAGDPALAGSPIRFEPRDALASGPDGLNAIRTISAAAPACLAAGGRLVLEHGATQGSAVRALLARAGFREVATRRDLAGHERVTAGAIW